MNILITAPKSYFIKNLISQIDKKLYYFYVIKKNNQDIKKIKSIFQKTKFKILDLNTICKSKNILNKYKIKIAINSINSYNDENKIFKIYNSNVTIPSILFDIIKQSNIQYFINIDTILDQRTNFYSLTKYIYRNYIKSSNDKKICIINLRFHNFYSYKINEKNFISQLSKLSKYRKKLYMTKGVQKRDFIHIKDAIELVIKIIENNSKFQKFNYLEFNIGGNQSMSILEIANFIRKYYKNDIKLNITKLEYKNKFEQKNYFSENRKILNYFNWQPKHSIKKRYI